MTRILENSFVFFVDADNIFFGARNQQTSQLNARIDFKALKDVALDGRSFGFSFFKVFASMRGDNNPDYFARMLRNNGFFSHIELRPMSPNASVKDMDVMIAVEAVTYRIEDYLPQVVSIASGDADFVPVYRYLKSQGVRVEVLSFPVCIGREVAQVADRVIMLSDRVIFNELAEPQKVSV